MSSPRRNRWAVVVATAGLVVGTAAAVAPAEAKTKPSKVAHPYEAIAGHYATAAQANAVANKARAKGFKAVVQFNRPQHIEVEYGNGWTTPGPALALCQKVKAAGLPCSLGQEQHSVPTAWGKP